MSGNNGMSIGEHIQREAGLKKLAEAEVCPIIPFDDNVVLRKIKPKDKTIAGIHLSTNPVLDGHGGTKESEPQKAVRNLGVVLAIGPGRPIIENGELSMDKTGVERLAVGDTVIMSRGNDVSPDGLDGETFVMCPAGSIIGKLVNP